MLAAAREVRINGQVIARTPLVVPSFSSKGFPAVEKIVDALSETITESTLISAYDIGKGIIKQIPQYASLLILDSGGYECSKDSDLSDNNMNTYRVMEWSIDDLKEVLDKWTSDKPTIAVSYDHPGHRCPIPEQITRANDLFARRALGKEILIKPTTHGSRRVHPDEVRACIHDLRHFDVIGFTEKELGHCVFDRMLAIARIRLALQDIGQNNPIHVFGSLDPISTPLYFFSGADIFDGLTWLRYAYADGQTVYNHNAGVLKYGTRVGDRDLIPRIWADNYQSLVNLQLAMKRYLKEAGQFDAFGDRLRGFFSDCVHELEAAL